MSLVTRINQFFSRYDARIVRDSYYQRLLRGATKATALELLERCDQDIPPAFAEIMLCSKSQLAQDLFVLMELDFKRDGFFVEFGATDGYHLSNTFLLEKRFNWSGILAEPAIKWHRALFDNRTAIIETECVWVESGLKLLFNEVDDGELSTIDNFSASDNHSANRKSGKKYEVKSISLNDLLDKHSAPEVVDYLSVDTEGSEYEILSKLDFGKRIFRVITVEHNHTKNREKIYRLLVSKGYARKFEDLSDFDDWYIFVGDLEK